MKNATLKWMMMLTLCLGFGLSGYAQELLETPKTDRKAIMDAHKATVEAIEADETLTQEQKDVRILEAREELRQKMRANRPEGKYRPGQGPGEERISKEEREALRAEFKAKMDAIDNNPDLSEEEKEAAKKALNQERKAMSKKHGKMKGKGKGKGKGHKAKEKRETLRAEHKAKVEAIDNDASLSEEEKEAAKKALNQERKAMKKEYGSKIKAEGKAKRAKLERKIESGLSEEEKVKVLNRLEKTEAKLDKGFAKGKISQENYDKRKAEIASLRSRL